jgi:signal transduction histidine kinase
VQILKQIATKRFWHSVAEGLIVLPAVALVTAVCVGMRLNVATAALLYIVVVVAVSRAGWIVASVVASILATVGLTYLAPPNFSFRVDDPLDVVAIVTFLFCSLIIAGLVSKLRKLMQEARASVDRGLIDAEERERARIARELHDDICQRMAILAIGIDELRTVVPSPTVKVVSSLDGLLDQAQHLTSDIQAVSHTLHSSKLEQLGLVRTMKSFCERFARQQKVEVHFWSHELSTKPPPEVSHALFRVLQEALHNSVKHSGTQEFEVKLSGASDVIHLAVRDSGVGFDPKVAMKNEGLGLISMRERMKLVNGEFSIDSHLNHGTTINAAVCINSTRKPVRATGQLGEVASHQVLRHPSPSNSL